MPKDRCVSFYSAAAKFYKDNVWSIFKSKVFDRFARKHDLTDADVRDAASDVMTGQVDADLGGGVFKQRIAQAGWARRAQCDLGC